MPGHHVPACLPDLRAEKICSKIIGPACHPSHHHRNILALDPLEAFRPDCLPCFNCSRSGPETGTDRARSDPKRTQQAIPSPSRQRSHHHPHRNKQNFFNCSGPVTSPGLPAVIRLGTVDDHKILRRLEPVMWLQKNHFKICIS